MPCSKVAVAKASQAVCTHAVLLPLNRPSRSFVSGIWNGCSYMTQPGTCDTCNRCCVCAVQYTREMDMMSHLPDHPNVLKLLGACTAPDKLILVMQHCSRYVASALQLMC